MLVVLSPAKKQNVQNIKPTSEPKYKNETEILVKELRGKSAQEIQTLMKISPDLAELNTTRFKEFDFSFQKNISPAIFTFQGDVYQALDAASLSEDDIRFCNQNFMIISGLYGLLKPTDAIQAYRLEMKTSLKSAYGKDLYEFWGDKLSEYLCEKLQNHQHKTIINLASQEYSKAIKHAKPHIIDIDFKEYKDGKYKTIGIHAKKARGLMARFIIMNKINSPEAIKEFNTLGYKYSQDMSEHNLYTFVR